MDMVPPKIKNFACLVFLTTFFLLSCSRKDGVSQHPLGTSDSVGIEDSLKTHGGAIVAVQLTYEQRQGKYLYAKFCSVCHGTEGKGDGFNAFNLDPRPKDFTEKQYMQALTDERLSESISHGGRGVNKSSSMPAWEGRLTKQEIEYLVAYVRTFAD
jgi:mono/diheme cytochrome c family protein